MRRVLFCAMVLASLAACGHGDQFTVPVDGADTPLESGNPARLTWNPAPDYDPAWLPDGSAIIYTAGQQWRDDDDQCLALLPPAGGRITRLLCENTSATFDSTTQWIAAGVSPSGRLVYMRTSRRIGSALPLTTELQLGRLDSAGGRGRLLTRTFTVPGLPPLLGTSHLTWLGNGALVFRGNFEGMLCEDAGPGCTPVFVRSGRGLVFMPVDTPSAARALPGTDYASSVTRGADDDELFFTLGGDGRVYRYVISTGATTVLYDFGATIARDVQVRGGRLLAVTGGRVSWQDRGITGWIQFDFGGELMLVDLASSSVARLTLDSMWVRQPVLSPDGARVVAEWQGELWLFTLP